MVFGVVKYGFFLVNHKPFCSSGLTTNSRMHIVLTIFPVLGQFSVTIAKGLAALETFWRVEMVAA